MTGSSRSIRWRTGVLLGVLAPAVLAAMGLTASPALAAKKVKACTVVPQRVLETAVGNPFDTPQDSSLGSFEASCRFAAADIGGMDLNLFVAPDVKAGIKDSFRGNYFATKKSFQKVYGQSLPVTGVGKQAFTAFDGTSSVAQGSLLALDTKNHAVLVVLTGEGVTADNTVEKGKAVAALVLAKLK